MMISLHGYVAAAPELGRPDTGGQVVYVLRLSEQLARLGWAVDIFTRRFEDQPEIEPVAAGARIVRIPAGGSELIRKEWLFEKAPEWVARAESWIRREGLAYAFIDSHYWDAGLAGAELARRLRIPHVHTPHSIGSWKRDRMDGDPADLERQYNFARRIRDERQVYRAASALVATSPQQRDLLIGSEYGADRSQVVVIPPGYDEARFFPITPSKRAEARRRLGFDRPTVLALGRVAANKGYDLLLQAMPVVRERIPAVELVLAVGSTSPTPGEAQQIEDLQRLARELGIDEHVEFRDYIPDDELATVYQAADVFALSSRYEPIGMTAIEAMACGTPTVITDQGGLHELLGWGRETIYADPTDPPAFGHAIATLLRYPDVANAISAAAAAKMRERFTWAGVARQLLDAMERSGAVPLIGRDGGPPPAAPRTHGRAERLEWVSATSS
jgi:mannosylfructose-phosphate synthase